MKDLSQEKYFEFISTSRKFVNKWISSVNSISMDNFVSDVKEADSCRFLNSYEWYEPETYPYTKNLIFENKNPLKVLLLFSLCCWMDMQMNYKIVWSRLLEQADRWVDNPQDCPIPRGSFPATTPNICKTLEVSVSNKNIARWFSEKILYVVKENGKSNGNLYRFLGFVMEELLEPSRTLRGTIYNLRHGNYGLLGNWKRAWMFIMFTRRDQNIIKNLFSSALESVDNGKEALKYWYDNNYFSEKESELPVDVRVQSAWSKMLNESNLDTKEIGIRAHNLALKYNIAPSAFDAVFFGYS